MRKIAIAAFLFLVGCAEVHYPALACERSFADLRDRCVYAPEMCATCPDAEDAFYRASERLGCGCPLFDCGAWWPLHATPAVYENALSCADLTAIMYDPRPWAD